MAAPQTHFRVVAPHFVCAITATSETVTDAAPIMRWAIGKSRGYVRDYARRKGWSIKPLCRAILQAEGRA